MPSKPTHKKQKSDTPIGNESPDLIVAIITDDDDDDGDGDGDGDDNSDSDD